MDRITSSTISLNLSLHANVEQATLNGSGSLNLIGSNGNNTLTGNIAANRIAGGLGQDTMTGGGGDDVFVFGSAAEIGGVDFSGQPVIFRDRITDFNHFNDKINLSAFMAGAVFCETGLIVGGQSVTFNTMTDVLSGSTDGDSQAEWTMFLPGTVVTAADIIF